MTQHSRYLDSGDRKATKDRRSPITVRELIAQLQRLDPALPVYTEGCDCIGPSDGVSATYTDATGVVIGRDDSLKDPNA